MTIKLAPPPLTVPSDFAQDKPKAKFFSALLNTVYQMWTALYSIRTTVKLKTTDDVATGLIRIPIEPGKAVMIEASVIAHRVGGSSGTIGDTAFYKLIGAYKNINGTLTGIGTPSLISGEDQSGWNVAFSSSLNGEALVVVTGAVGNDIVWEGTISTYFVGE